MTLIDRYLAAVAAQLPKAQREDITAELRDDIETRIEAREDNLGRPLTDDEIEAVLREVGHPLTVAGRYRAGPQHLVGPELYPWWLFGVKVGLVFLAAVVLLGAIVQTVIGEIEVGRAIGRAFHDLFNGGVMLIGLATIAGFIIERMEKKPAFLTDWRVKDLAMFQFDPLDADAINKGIADSQKSAARASGRPVVGFDGRSPVARALTSAAAHLVLLMWWAGALNVGGVDFSTDAVMFDGVAYGDMLDRLVVLIWWPVIAYLVARIAFDLFRAANPGAARAIAFGDLVLAAVRLAGFLWAWTNSPLSDSIRVYSLNDLVERAQALFHGEWTLAAVLTLCVAFGMVASVFEMLQAGWRMARGRAD